MIKKIILFTFFIAILVVIILLSRSNYNQNKNIEKILEKDLIQRVIPHKVNYLNKLNNILNDKLCAFEFDVTFNLSNPTPYFEIGHDSTELNGVSFEKYLIFLKDKNIKKIWMDIKHVQEKDIAKILARLEYLDKIYHIKDILIFESNSVSPKIKLISNAGYHTSYYLPIDKLIMIPLTNKKLSILEAIKLKEQIGIQNLQAVSFPTYTYPFVKKYLEPILKTKLDYHVWDRYKIKKKNEFLKIQKSDFFHDERVKTILFSYDNNKLNRLYSF